MNDAKTNGRRFRLFNVVDDLNQETLAIEVDLNIPALRGYVFWNDSVQKGSISNGPELIATALVEWLREHRVTLNFIQS